MTAAILSRCVCFLRLVVRAGAALLASSVLAQAQTPLSAPTRCVDRFVPEPGVSVAQYVPSLKYACLPLRNGRFIRVGQAGQAQGATVLLVHGLGSFAHRDWRYAIPALARQFRVVAVDLPGFGASESLPQGYSFAALAAVLADTLDGLAIERAHVVGHSLGGALSLQFAHSYPQRVDRLVLVDAAGILQKVALTRYLAQVDLPRVGFAPADRFLDGLDQRINGLSGLLLNRIEGRVDLAALLGSNPSIRGALIGRYTNIDAALGLVEHDFTRSIRELATPTMLIWGRNDPIAPLRTGVLLASRLRDARLAVLDGVGHSPLTESPERFMAVLLPALAAPLPPKFVAAIPDLRYGKVTCTNRNNAFFTGHFDSLTLQNCRNARIANARIKQLTVTSSSVALVNVIVDSSGTALHAVQSEVMATAVEFRGRVALRVEDSQLDLAGVTVRATQRGLDVRGVSRVYFSVSDLLTPERIGDAHFVWSQAAPPKRAR